MAEKLTMSPMECCEAFHVVPDGFEPIQMSPPKFKAMCMANRFDWCVPIPMKQDEFLISRAGFYAWLDSSLATQAAKRAMNVNNPNK